MTTRVNELVDHLSKLTVEHTWSKHFGSPEISPSLSFFFALSGFRIRYAFKARFESALIIGKKNNVSTNRSKSTINYATIL